MHVSLVFPVFHELSGAPLAVGLGVGFGVGLGVGLGVAVGSHLFAKAYL